jgi:hypothetical protein
MSIISHSTSRTATHSSRSAPICNQELQMGACLRVPCLYLNLQLLVAHRLRTCYVWLQIDLAHPATTKGDGNR